MNERESSLLLKASSYRNRSGVRRTEDGRRTTEDGQRRVGRQEAQKTQESDGTAQDGWRRAEGGRLRGSISGFFGLFWISVLTRFDSCKTLIQFFHRRNTEIDPRRTLIYCFLY